MPTEYALSDLVKLTGVTERTVRYYIAQGLLAAPIGKGPAARYTDAHLDRLRLIKKMQLAHLPLAEIRRQIDEVSGEDSPTLAMSEPEELPSSQSALDYIDSVLGRSRSPAPPAAAAPAPSMPLVRAAGAPEPEPSRAQWERIVLDPDVEIHIRRPLTRHKNRSIERLITIARQLLEE
jgi:DNA-binding transcriptional MerR regulator